MEVHKANNLQELSGLLNGSAKEFLTPNGSSAPNGSVKLNLSSPKPGHPPGGAGRGGAGRGGAGRGGAGRGRIGFTRFHSTDSTTAFLPPLSPQTKAIH